jgi:hypothetical protein
MKKFESRYKEKFIIAPASRDIKVGKNIGYLYIHIYVIVNVLTELPTR